MPKDIIDARIKEYVNEILSKKEMPDDIEFIATDNFGELIDKLCIVHIRAWQIEDQIVPGLSNEEVGVLKRKLDTTFKVHRPRLVAAINKLIEKAVVEGKSLEEDSVKMYK